jgi:putative Holliday junction resolvase
MTPSQGRILALDYGRKRIGVAVSDPLRITAQGLPTIIYKTQSEALEKLRQILAKYEISELVVGFPLTLKGEMGIAAKTTKLFFEHLKDEFGLPTTLWDERFSSVSAHRVLNQLGKAPSRNKQKVDQISAVLILQCYLDYLHRKNK